MKSRFYLLLALVAFIAATTGSDLIARTSIAGETFRDALNSHLYWAWKQPVATLFLFLPFWAVGLISAGVAKRGLSRSAALIFAAGTVTLLYFYFDGHQSAQQAMLDRHWTAATFAVGLLPFLIGIPTVLAVAGAGAVAVARQRRTST